MDGRASSEPMVEKPSIPNSGTLPAIRFPSEIINSNRNSTDNSDRENSINTSPPRSNIPSSDSSDSPRNRYSVLRKFSLSNSSKTGGRDDQAPLSLPPKSKNSDTTLVSDGSSTKIHNQSNKRSNKISKPFQRLKNISLVTRNFSSSQHLVHGQDISKIPHHQTTPSSSASSVESDRRQISQTFKTVTRSIKKSIHQLQRPRSVSSSKVQSKTSPESKSNSQMTEVEDDKVKSLGEVVPSVPEPKQMETSAVVSSPIESAQPSSSTSPSGSPSGSSPKRLKKVKQPTNRGTEKKRKPVKSLPPGLSPNKFVNQRPGSYSGPARPLTEAALDLFSPKNENFLATNDPNKFLAILPGGPSPLKQIIDHNLKASDEGNEDSKDEKESKKESEGISGDKNQESFIFIRGGVSESDKTQEIGTDTEGTSKSFLIISQDSDTATESRGQQKSKKRTIGDRGRCSRRSSNSQLSAYNYALGGYYLRGKRTKNGSTRNRRMIATMRTKRMMMMATMSLKGTNSYIHHQCYYSQQSRKKIHRLRSGSLSSNGNSLTSKLTLMPTEGSDDTMKKKGEQEKRGLRKIPSDSISGKDRMKNFKMNYWMSTMIGVVIVAILIGNYRRKF
ncbi:expressed protein [Phakopsora pachyrhizi]|uniref:Expressed protein n=1 Tax=Phakopsora pachyrhizi TaxID=170000 RepID=A0AAV0BBG6_PHAPC|nr:expressed protein [Phakopsora pachyrhizi]